MEARPSKIEDLDEGLGSAKRPDLIGFFRHGQEGLNDEKRRGKQPKTAAASPSLALFNATCTRLSLDRLLPSRAYLRFTGQSYWPVIKCYVFQ